MALFRTRSAAVYGTEAHLIDVEVDMYPGGGRDFITVGMPDTAVRESRERIKSALLNSGLVYRHAGDNMLATQVVKVPVKSLVDAQTGMVERTNPTDPCSKRLFKNLPPGWRDGRQKLAVETEVFRKK